MPAPSNPKEELAAHQIILAGRFYGNTRGTAGQSQAYYDNLKRIKGDMAEAKGRVGQGDDADAVLRDVPLATLNGSTDMLDKDISNLVKLRRQIQAGDSADKREQVKAINAEIEQRMYRLNKAVKDTLSMRRDHGL